MRSAVGCIWLTVRNYSQRGWQTDDWEQVAMAWARQVMADCFPILGGTNIDHLKGNIEVRT